MKYGDQPITREKFEVLEEREQSLNWERTLLDRLDSHRLVLPNSTQGLRILLREELGRACADSAELAGLPRLLVPEFFVYSVRLWDGGHLLPRALLTVDLAAGFPDVRMVPFLAGLLRCKVSLDLFDRPPQRDRIRDEVVRLAALRPKWSQARIDAILSERVKQPVVQKALALQQTMEVLGLTSPYVLGDSPRDDYPKLRRHKPPRYELDPLDGYVRPAL